MSLGSDMNHLALHLAQIFEFLFLSARRCGIIRKAIGKNAIILKIPLRKVLLVTLRNDVKLAA